MMAVVISFLGFVLENIWLAFTKGFIDNRNMTLPFLLGYGMLVVGFYLFVGTPDTFASQLFGREVNDWVSARIAYFSLTFLIVCVGELIVGFATEKMFGFYYWNYERLPMHFTRYTSVPTSLGFATVITVFMDICFDPLYRFIGSIQLEVLKPAAIISIVILSLDFVSSFYKMHKLQAPNVRWEIRSIDGERVLKSYKNR